MTRRLRAERPTRRERSAVTTDDEQPARPGGAPIREAARVGRAAPDQPSSPARRSTGHRHVVAQAGELQFERVFFSDAVFAIAATLLVFNIKIPAAVGTGTALARFGRGLDQENGRILSWALSFYMIGRYWIAHHTMFRYIRHLDRRLIALNLLFLACIAFLPYATAVLGTWGGTSPGVAFYAAATAAVGLAQGAIWFHAARGDRLTVPGVSASLRNAWMLNLLQTPIVFLVSIPVAFVSPVIAVCLWALSLLVRRVLRRRVQAALDELDTATT
jgi:TMEM175 potassium channel family protein